MLKVFEMGDVDVIKRPLVWILNAYLMGMYLAWHKISFLIIFLIMSMGFLFIYLLMFHSKKKNLFRRDRFLWCLPILMVLGVLIMNDKLKNPDVTKAFHQEIYCELTGSITMVVQKKSGSAIYLKNDIITIPGDRSYPCEQVIVFYSEEQRIKQDNKDKYLVGNTIAVKGTLQKFKVATNPGQFNEQLYYQVEDIDFKMKADLITITDADYSLYHNALGGVKDQLIKVYDSILSDKEAGALIAMLLGEKYLLNDEIKELYQQNGISHILAISGLHVSLIGMILFYLLKKLKIPVTFAVFLSIFFIYSYGALTNFSVSTNRAVVMMIVLLLATIAGKTYDMLSATSLSALIILLQNPIQILSAGFQLSFGAVLGIAIIFPCLKRLFPSKNPVINSLLISVSAQLATMPFILWFYYQLPTYSIITNLIILPFITALTLTSILAGILGSVSLPLGIFLIGGANYILKFYEWICRIGDRLPANLITIGKPESLDIILYAGFLCGFLWVAKRYQKKSSILLLVIANLFLLIPKRNVGFEITFLDVGQGDAIYMESGSETTYLVDGGSSDVSEVGIYRLTPFLLSKGTDHLDYAVITHSDSDHISGLIQLMELDKIEIKNLILPYLEEKDKTYVELETLAKKREIPVQYIKAGDIFRDGDVRIICLHPDIQYHPSTSNSYSTVLSISYGEFDLLLTGDLQKDGEQRVSGILHNDDYWNPMDIRPAIQYEVLKVSHHGSKTSSTEEFLSFISPEVSIISCGEDNYYGHPHQEVLHRLEQLDSNIKITYKTGAITILTDGKRMQISEFLLGE